MTTLIAQYNSQGQCTGRCDASCYNAAKPRCICICNGANHGIGLDAASAQTPDTAIKIALETSQHKITFDQDAHATIEPLC